MHGCSTRGQAIGAPLSVTPNLRTFARRFQCPLVILGYTCKPNPPHGNGALVISTSNFASEGNFLAGKCPPAHIQRKFHPRESFLISSSDRLSGAVVKTFIRLLQPGYPHSRWIHEATIR